MLFHVCRINAASLAGLARAGLIAWLLPAPAVAADSPVLPHQNEKEQESREPAGSVSFAALAGWNLGDDGGYRALFGYGGRGGYRFARTPLYLGLTVVTYSAEMREAPEYGGMLYGTELHITTDIDIGAEFLAGPLLVRPYLGLGVLTSIYDAPPNSNSGLAPRVVPALHASYPIGIVDIGLDARYETSSPRKASATLLGSVGLRL